MDQSLQLQKALRAYAMNPAYTEQTKNMYLKMIHMLSDHVMMILPEECKDTKYDDIKTTKDIRCAFSSAFVPIPKQPIDHERIALMTSKGRVVGAGAYGSVVEAGINLNESEIEFVVKYPLTYTSQVISEAVVSLCVINPFIDFQENVKKKKSAFVPCLGIFFCPQVRITMNDGDEIPAICQVPVQEYKQTPSVFLAYEKAKGVALFQYLYDMKSYSSEIETKEDEERRYLEIMFAVFCELAELQEYNSGYYHFDLKADNILIDLEDTCTVEYQTKTYTFPFRIRIIDYGLSSFACEVEGKEEWFTNTNHKLPTAMYDLFYFLEVNRKHTKTELRKKMLVHLSEPNNVTDEIKDRWEKKYLLYLTKHTTVSDLAERINQDIPLVSGEPMIDVMDRAYEEQYHLFRSEVYDIVSRHKVVIGNGVHESEMISSWVHKAVLNRLRQILDEIEMLSLFVPSKRDMIEKTFVSLTFKCIKQFQLRMNKENMLHIANEILVFLMNGYVEKQYVRKEDRKHYYISAATYYRYQYQGLPKEDRLFFEQTYFKQICFAVNSLMMKHAPSIMEGWNEDYFTRLRSIQTSLPRYKDSIIQHIRSHSFDEEVTESVMEKILFHTPISSVIQRFLPSMKYFLDHPYQTSLLPHSTSIYTNFLTEQNKKEVVEACKTVHYQQVVDAIHSIM